MISLIAFESGMPRARKIDIVKDAIYLIRGQRVMLGAIMLASGTQASSLCGTRTSRLRSFVQQQAGSPLAAQPRWLCSIRERSARYRTK
jgi:hypothetical protein